MQKSETSVAHVQHAIHRCHNLLDLPLFLFCDPTELICLWELELVGSLDRSRGSQDPDLIPHAFECLRIPQTWINSGF